MATENLHKAGFVSLIGRPNVGKSTLMNALMGERLSIITRKAQTTRHRIRGILSGPDFQIVYSDTPGILDPAYALQEKMLSYISEALSDADVIFFMAELGEKAWEHPLIEKLKRSDKQVLLVMNKIDQAKGSQVLDKLSYWQELYPDWPAFAISAQNGTGIPELLAKVIELLPVHPPYFAKDSLTDKSERFFAGEFVREQLFLHFSQEVPYSTEVEVEEFKEDKNLIRIRSIIYVERKSQKGIIIGKGGEMLKKIGIGARKEMEAFFGKQVFLETYVKVADSWRSKERSLKRFGY